MSDWQGLLTSAASIDTARLSLVTFEERFITDDLVSWLNNKSVLRFSENRHRNFSRENALEYLAHQREAGNSYWAILRRYDGVHIGNIGAVIDRANSVANLGILIGKIEAHGVGYGLEAWCAALKWLLTHGLRKVEAGAMAEHIAMIRIFERSGMKIEARQIGHFWYEGRPVDLILAGRLTTRLSGQWLHHNT